MKSLKRKHWTKSPVRLAFVGSMGSGKTSCAEYVVQSYGVKKISLAEPVKRIASVADEPENIKWPLLYDWAERLGGGGYTPEYLASLWYVDLKRYSGRELLQKIGTDSGRSVDKKIWINRFLKTHQLDLRSNNNPYVVDDVRFVNEAEALRNHGFVIVKLMTNDFTRQERMRLRDGKKRADEKFSYLSNHPSETELESIRYDSLLLNHGPFYDTERKIDDLVKAFFRDGDTLVEDLKTKEIVRELVEISGRAQKLAEKLGAR